MVPTLSCVPSEAGPSQECECAWFIFRAAPRRTRRKAGNTTGKEKKQIHQIPMSRLPLQAAQAQCFWEPLENNIKDASGLSHWKDEETGKFTHQLLLPQLQGDT